MRKLIKFLNFLRTHIVIVTIVGLAFVLRLQYISFLPPSLNWDEVSHGFNAYSILKTGRDEWGLPFPIIFRAYGDYKLPVYIYLTAFSELVFGLNELSVRLPSILAGTASVLFTYLLVNQLTRKRRLAFLAALLLAVEPWGLFISRIASEANVSLALIISGIYFFLRGLKNTKYLIFSSVLLGLSVWTYNSARIFAPLILLSLVIIYKKELLFVWKRKRKFVIYSLVIATFFSLPMFWQLANPQGQARYAWVAILDEGARASIDEARLTSDLPGVLPRLVHNKATFFAKRFITNYFSHFSLDFLFLQGGSHYQFSIPNHGLLYLVNLPFFLLGLVILLLSFRKDRSKRLILAWFLLAPVASSLTREAPHVLRSIVFLPTPQIISAVGLASSFIWLRKRLKASNVYLAGAYFFVLLFQIENYRQVAVTQYREKYSWAWQYGYKKAVSYVKENYHKYDKIIVTKKYGEPHEFFLFYWPWNPQTFQDDPELIRFYQSNWYWVDRFDNFYFVNDWDIPEEGNIFVLESEKEISCQQATCLLVTSPGNYPRGWRLLQTVNFLDQKLAFEIYEKIAD